MIKYSSTPNAYNAVKSAIAAVLPVYNDVGWKDIAIAFADSINTVWANIKHGDATMCKDVRKQLMADITRFIKGAPVETVAMRRLLEKADICNYDTKLQLMFSLADSPKFLMYSERELRSMAENIEDHQDEINAITYSDSDGTWICPYRPDCYHDNRDLIKTIMAQKDNILKFLLNGSKTNTERNFYQHNFSRLSLEIIRELREMKKKIARYSEGSYIPSCLEKEWFDSVLYIQSHIDKCAAAMKEYSDGNAKSDMFSLSESKSPISDNDQVMQILHKLGWNKGSCPAVLSNLFYSNKLSLIGVRQQEGQICLDYDLYFSPAPGLGPMYKVRWVYSIDTNINNLLTPLADLIQKADKLYDRNEAYNDQLTYLLDSCPFITDAFCTDSTGYSDYLWIGIYRYIMELYCLPYDQIEQVMKCFELPVKIGNKLIKVEFGTFQGCKLLVFIMNHANRLMGIIADNISSNKVISIRPNAGDDVIKAALGGKFCQDDIYTEVLTFAVFNCPTNASKSAWLQQDGYVDFCSKYFAMVNGSLCCVSGVPAKKYGKEIICIADWAESYKVLESSGQSHTNCLNSFEMALPILYDSLREGCRLPNIYSIAMTVESKVEQAKSIPFTFGGLAESDIEQNLDKLIETLKYKASLLLSSYTYQPMGVFLVANRIQNLADTELFKAIGSISRQAVRDLVKLIKMLAEPGSMSFEDLEWAKESIAKFERNSINGQSLSRTSSTYHRIERNRDVDLLFPIDSIQSDIGMPLPENKVSALLMVSILTNSNFVDIDNMRKYIDVMQILKKYPGLLRKYYGIGNDSYYAIEDPYSHNWYRIYNNDDERYPPLTSLENCSNAEIKRMVQILRDCHASDIVQVFYGTGEQLSEGQLQQLTKRIVNANRTNLTAKYVKAIIEYTIGHYTN